MREVHTHRSLFRRLAPDQAGDLLKFADGHMRTAQDHEIDGALLAEFFTNLVIGRLIEDHRLDLVADDVLLRRRFRREADHMIQGDRARRGQGRTKRLELLQSGTALDPLKDRHVFPGQLAAEIPQYGKVLIGLQVHLHPDQVGALPILIQVVTIAGTRPVIAAARAVGPPSRLVRRR